MIHLHHDPGVRSFLAQLTITAHDDSPNNYDSLEYCEAQIIDYCLWNFGEANY